VEAGAVELVHGTAIALAGRAALIRGPSGSGKSDLALRCLMQPPTRLLPTAVELVADDQVVIERRDHNLWVRSPPAIRGLLEVRGLGIMRIPAIESAQLSLVVDLIAADKMERMPEPRRDVVVGGVRAPCIELAPFEISAPFKLLLALQEASTQLDHNSN
jgi:serine kinase of HPr protein (carbohydrate metabolism regulator)